MCCRNVKAMLEAGGSSMERVVRVGVSNLAKFSVSSLFLPLESLFLSLFVYVHLVLESMIEWWDGHWTCSGVDVLGANVEAVLSRSQCGS